MTAARSWRRYTKPRGLFGEQSSSMLHLLPFSQAIVRARANFSGVGIQNVSGPASTPTTLAPIRTTSPANPLYVGAR
eukprot:1247278-Prymnesium_polylepis.1